MTIVYIGDLHCHIGHIAHRLVTVRIDTLFRENVIRTGHKHSRSHKAC